MTLGKEPTLIIQSIVAAATAIQVAAISMSPLAHMIVAIVVIAGGALVNRQVVTPAKAKPAPVRHRTPPAP